MPQSKTTCTSFSYVLIGRSPMCLLLRASSFPGSTLLSTPSEWLLGASFFAVYPEQAAPLVLYLSLLYKKPWPLLCWLPAFNISPRLPIVYDSPLCLPGFSFPQSPEISFSHVPGGVPQGWVACHCLRLFNFFLSPIPPKSSQNHHTCPCRGLPVTDSSPRPVLGCVCVSVVGVGGTLAFCYPALMGVPLKCRGPCGRLGKAGVLGGHPRAQRTCF